MNWTPLHILLAAGLSLAATLPYQGLATDAKGKPVADGRSKASFALYRSPSGGTALWSESQEIQTTKGLFSTSLGRTLAIPDSLFQGSALYLGVALDGGSESDPRLELAIPPYAIRSRSSDSALGSLRADTAKVARHLIGEDSLTLRRVRDSLADLATRRLTDSVSAWIARDSVSKLASRSNADSARRDRDSAALARVRDSVVALSVKAKTDSLSLAHLSRKFELLSAATLPLVHTTPSNAPGWNSNALYGYFQDVRDRKVYRTVRIGSQVWMAENLNYSGPSQDALDSVVAVSAIIGSCYLDTSFLDLAYRDPSANCAIFGRLYSWDEAMQGSSASSLGPSGVQGICPEGWHVPSDLEWTTMEATGPRTATFCSTTKGGLSECRIVSIPDSMGVRLSSSTVWRPALGRGLVINGTDDFGFRALPGGNDCKPEFPNGSQEIGNAGFWWTSSGSSTLATAHYRRAADLVMKKTDESKTCQFSLRCVKDPVKP